MNKEWINNNQQFLKEYTIKYYPCMEIKNHNGNWDILLHKNYKNEKITYIYYPLHQPEFQFIFTLEDDKYPKGSLAAYSYISLYIVVKPTVFETKKTVCFLEPKFNLIKKALRERNLNLL
jgi:hypothetical protein